MRAILPQGHAIEMRLEMLLPNLCVPVHGGHSEISRDERKVGVLVEVDDCNFAWRYARAGLIDRQHEFIAQKLDVFVLHVFVSLAVLLTQPLTALLSDCLAVYNLCSAIAHIK